MVVSGLSLSALGILGRRLERWIALVIAAVVIVAPGVFQAGMQSWVQRESTLRTKQFREWLRNVPAFYTTTTSPPSQ
jgi:hypothetical protein